MTYLVLWNAVDHLTLFESEEYETYPEAVTALADFHARYPWNTYLLVRIEKAERGTGKPPRDFEILSAGFKD